MFCHRHCSQFPLITLIYWPHLLFSHYYYPIKCLFPALLLQFRTTVVCLFCFSITVTQHTIDANKWMSYPVWLSLHRALTSNTFSTSQWTGVSNIKCSNLVLFLCLSRYTPQNVIFTSTVLRATMQFSWLELRWKWHEEPTGDKGCHRPCIEDTVQSARCLFLHCYMLCASVTTVKCLNDLHKQIQPWVFKLEMLQLCMPEWNVLCLQCWGC